MKPETERRLVVASIVLLLLPILPIWYYTTQVYRAPLPFEAIKGLPSNPQVSIQWTINVNGNASKYLKPVVNEKFRVLIGQKSSERDIPGNYELTATCSQSLAKPHLTIGSERKLSLSLDCTKSSPSMVLDRLLSQVFEPETTREQEMKALGYSDYVNVMFTLVQEDSTLQKISVDFDGAIDEFVLPLVKELSDIANIRIHTQTIPFAKMPIGVRSVMTTDNRTVYGLVGDELSFFVDSADWNLGTFLSLAQPLRFLIYVPEHTKRPLYILHKNRFAPKNAFLIPRWGGVLIYNPPSVKDFRIEGDELRRIMGVLVHQLRETLGVTVTLIDPEIATVSVDPSVKAISKLELDLLRSKRTKEALASSTQTLQSLGNLITSMENMVVKDKIAEMVNTSLESLSQAYSLISRGEYAQAWISAKQAFTTAQAAFFDPTMVSLLYFPDEHKYAVYLPLFFPVLFPILVAVIGEVKGYRQRRKEQEKQKKE